MGEKLIVITSTVPGSIIILVLQEFAHQHDMLFFETSCKDGTNVELAVMTMVAKIMEGTSRKTEKQAKIR